MAKGRERKVLAWTKGPSWNEATGKVQSWLPSSPGIHFDDLGWSNEPVGPDEDIEVEPAFEIWYQNSHGYHVWEVVQHYDGATVETFGDDEEGAFLLATELNVAAIRKLLAR
jgi:hypothetical protein